MKQGKQLVIFDNLVLNLNGYERVHPGGKFNLIHNLGRDVSKFFYGGYNLVNEKSHTRPHHHTQPALDIVKTMIVGVIEGQTKVADESFKLSNKTEVNSDTSTFTFTGVSGKPINNLKSWYNDPNMIGRHFLVYNAKNPRTKRQYTICSSMNADVRDELLNLANGIITRQVGNFDYSMMLGQDQR